jgi:hypothetical protein
VLCPKKASLLLADVLRIRQVQWQSGMRYEFVYGVHLLAHRKVSGRKWTCLPFHLLRRVFSRRLKRDLASFRISFRLILNSTISEFFCSSMVRLMNTSYNFVVASRLKLNPAPHKVSWEGEETTRHHFLKFVLPQARHSIVCGLDQRHFTAPS